MSESIRAVAFDFGGVLTLAPGPEHWNALMGAIGGANGAARIAIRLEDVQRWYHAGRDAFDQGVLSSWEYWEEILRGLGVPGTGDLARRLFELDTTAWTRSRTEMLGWAAQLRAAGVRTGILSNMPSEVLTRIEKRMGWVAEFSPCVYSCRLGLIKPEPAIYRALLSELAVPPAAVLFLDDRLENVQAARAEGMAAEQFESLEQILPIVADRYALPGFRRDDGREGASSS